MATPAATRRIHKELAALTNSPLPSVSVGPASDENILRWTGFIAGPAASPYSGGTFKLKIDFPTDFPFKPPKILFMTKIYHPNVDEEGAICLGLLKTDSWKPATKVSDILLALVQLLQEPNPDDPLVTSIAEQFKNEHDKYVKTAIEWVKKYAK